MLTYYIVIEQRKIEGPYSLATIWTYNARIQLALWGALTVTFLQKELGNRLRVKVLAYSFRIMAFIYTWSFLLSIPMQFTMFTGYNNLYLEDYTKTTLDKYDLWTLYTVQNIGWVTAVVLKQHVIWGKYGKPERISPLDEPGI